MVLKLMSRTQRSTKDMPKARLALWLGFFASDDATPASTFSGLCLMSEVWLG